MARGEIATPEQRAVAADEAEERSILTGEVLRERGLCPLVVVRSWDSGVHIGLLARYDRSNGDVELFDARRLHRWRGANTLHEVALRGIDTAHTRLSEPVRLIAVPGVCEVLPVAEAARESLTTSRWARE